MSWAGLGYSAAPAGVCVCKLRMMEDLVETLQGRPHQATAPTGVSSVGNWNSEMRNLEHLPNVALHGY